jgi:hypothetical protein
MSQAAISGIKHLSDDTEIIIKIIEATEIQASNRQVHSCLYRNCMFKSERTINHLERGPVMTIIKVKKHS